MRNLTPVRECAIVSLDRVGLSEFPAHHRDDDRPVRPQGRTRLLFLTDLQELTGRGDQIGFGLASHDLNGRPVRGRLPADPRDRTNEHADHDQVRFHSAFLERPPHFQLHPGRYLDGYREAVRDSHNCVPGHFHPAALITSTVDTTDTGPRDGLHAAQPTRLRLDGFGPYRGGQGRALDQHRNGDQQAQEGKESQLHRFAPLLKVGKMRNTGVND